MNIYFLLAALADFTAVVMHGIVGHRAIITPLTRDRLFATRAFGDTDMSRRILVVTWHIVTAAFAFAAVVLSLLSFGLVTGAAVPRFLAAMHASFLLVGLGVVGGRFRALLRPIPALFAICMSTVCLTGWLGSR